MDADLRLEVTAPSLGGGRNRRSVLYPGGHLQINAGYVVQAVPALHQFTCVHYF